MKKLYFILMSCVIFTSVFTSCSPKKPQTTDTTDPLTTTATTPNVTSDGQTSTTPTTTENASTNPQEETKDELVTDISKYTPPSIDFTFKDKDFFDESPVYQGGEMSFDLVLEIGDEKELDAELGIVVALNGVLQNVSLNGGESSSMPTITAAPESSTDVKLSFTPTVATGDKTDSGTVQIMIVNRPDFTITNEFPSGFIAMIQHGMVYFNFDLIAETPFAEKETKTFDNSESELITEEISERYQTTAGGTTFQLRNPNATPEGVLNGAVKSESNEETVDMGVVTQVDGKAKVDFFATIDIPEKFRVAFFVGSKQVTVNGGFEYLTCDVKKGFLTTAEIEFDNVKSGDIISAIATPINGANFNNFFKTAGVVVE
jgi:hypothetical protein